MAADPITYRRTELYEQIWVTPFPWRSARTQPAVGET
jgi:hypothetical protein